YETKLNLASGIKTILRRDFGDSEKASSGVTISFEKIGGKDTGLSVISTPDESQVTIDGQIRGFTPYKTTTISEGEHEIIVSSEGYAEMVVSIKTREGFQLTADVKLAPGGEEKEEGKEEEKKEETDEEPLDEEIFEKEKEQIEIIDTPTGFLRVRLEPSTLAKEVARVSPGDTFDLLDTDDDTGWYKIEYEKDSEGWITDKYAKIVGEEEEED
ncbi:PEGA domain-containing protein, partial [Patescibacteria group bacterium]